MSKSILMQTEEPSDEILSKLMKEVALEPKKKALISEKNFLKRLRS